jgi:hypothetical protein
VNGEDGVPVYQVERVIPGAGLAAVDAIRRRALEACMTLEAGEVHYHRSTFTPGDSRCRCLFQAPSADHVRRLNDAAKLPYSRIVVAVDYPEQ